MSAARCHNESVMTNTAVLRALSIHSARLMRLTFNRKNKNKAALRETFSMRTSYFTTKYNLAVPVNPFEPVFACVTCELSLETKWLQITEIVLRKCPICSRPVRTYWNKFNI